MPTLNSTNKKQIMFKVMKIINDLFEFFFTEIAQKTNLKTFLHSLFIAINLSIAIRKEKQY